MLSVNPKLVKLSFAEFSAWLKKSHPEADAEQLYKSIGGKVPEKKKKEA